MPGRKAHCEISHSFCYILDMLTLFDDTDLFNSGKLKIIRFNTLDAEVTLYEHFFTRGNSWSLNILEEL